VDALRFQGLDYRPRVRYNPSLESANFIVPGIIAIIMMMFGSILTALTIVREKVRGTFEQIVTSPVSPLVFLMGKIIPYVVIALVDMVLIVLVGYLVFGVPIKGSIVLLFVSSLFYLTGILGIGLLVSTIAETEESAMLLAVILSLLPSILLSGFIFPIENMPGVLQLVTYIVPARYFLVIIRGLYLKATTIRYIIEPLLFLVVFGIAIFSLSVSRFRKHLE
jgi:ABC-2 type transport system permease protein